MCSVAVVRCHRPNAQQLKIGSGPHSLSLTSVSCALRLQQCLGGDSFRFLGLVQPSPLILEGLERLVNLVSIKVGRLVVVHVLAPTHDSDIKFRVSLVCVQSNLWTEAAYENHSLTSRSLPRRREHKR